MNYNKVILVGNLTRDPQLSFLPSKTAVTEFGLAMNRKWKSADGQQREDTCFVDCKAFGKSAETINQYVKKGQPLLIDGRLDFSTWEAQDGQKRSKLRVVVERFQFMGTQTAQPATRPASAPAPARQAPAPQPPPQAPAPQPAAEPDQGYTPPDDDIAF